MKDLKSRTIRGGLAKVCSQGAGFVLRTVSLIVMARLLDPQAFGLVGMVTAITGVLNLFRDFGLSAATVQRGSVTKGEVSTLFWINILVGAALCALSIASAPFVAAFYHQPRLAHIMVALAFGFVVNAAGVQHSASLERAMRFTTLSIIDIVSQIISTAIGIGMAMKGYGYWSLVVMTLIQPAAFTACVWIVAPWVPGVPRSGTGIRSLLRFGGTVTVNGLVVYVAYNLEKVLLGRYWGPDSVGIYGRAYQLANLPTDNLNSSVGGVAFAALSRLQNEPDRLRNCFLKIYSLILALTIPITVVIGIFAPDAIVVVLGPKWQAAAPILRYLAPTIVCFAMMNPFAWLLFALGMVGRSLRIALVITPLVITGYVIGLPYGPKGVALGYSLAMASWVLPHIAWSVRGTAISFWDALATIVRPLVGSAVAAAPALAVELMHGTFSRPLARLSVGLAVFGAAYVATLLYALGQKSFYLDVVRGLRNQSSVDSAMVTA